MLSDFKNEDMTYETWLGSMLNRWAGSHISLSAPPSTVPYNAMQVAINQETNLLSGELYGKQKPSQYHIHPQKHNWVVNEPHET